MYRTFLVVLCVFLVSCNATQDPIKVGVVLPLTGPFKIYGDQGLNGAKLAVEEINAQGGVLGRPLELVVRDNETDPALSVRHSRELVQIDNVFALLGSVSSAARYAMSDVAQRFKVPMLYGIDYEGRHYDRYLICYSTIPEHYVDPIIPFLVQASGDRFYIFGYDYIWPHQMSERIIKEVTKAGGSIAGIEFPPFSVTDYGPVLQRIKDSGANNLMLILPGRDGFNFLEQKAAFNIDRNLKTIAFAADETYLTEVSSTALEGTLTPLHFFSSWNDPVFNNFVAAYKAKFGAKQPETYASKSHYDLIYLMSKSIEASGALDREKVIDNLHELFLYEGATRVSLRDDNHFNLPMFLAEYKAGDLKVIKSLGIIQPDDQRNAQ